MPAILAVETSTLTASVAILVDGKIAIEKESGVNSHSELLLPLIDECLHATDLKLADLSTIAVGAGPGSFTGLRIGMATVKGLCFATDLSVTPVSSLAALALDCQRAATTDALIVPVLDARRKEVYVGFYQHEGSTLCSRGQEQVIPPQALAELVASQSAGAVILCGDGACKYESVLTDIGDIDLESRQTPSAGAIARLAQHIAPSDLLASAAPTYVRLPEAMIKFPDGNPGGTFSVPKSGSDQTGGGGR
jgi:tRNA threonylcarbamoyladenosine biosynthesis protein TsaB